MTMYKYSQSRERQKSFFESTIEASQVRHISFLPWTAANGHVSDWQVAINILPTAPIRAPVHPMNGFCKRTMFAGRHIFPLPTPSLSSFLNPLSSPSESFLGLPQPSVSFIIQDGGIEYSYPVSYPLKIRLLCRL